MERNAEYYASAKEEAKAYADTKAEDVGYLLILTQRQLMESVDLSLRQTEELLKRTSPPAVWGGNGVIDTPTIT